MPARARKAASVWRPKRGGVTRRGVAHGCRVARSERGACAAASRSPFGGAQAPARTRVDGLAVLKGSHGRADDHRDDQPVDPEHARHHDRDDVLHDERRVDDAHGRDAAAALSGAVGRAEVGEDERERRAHEAEEGRVRRVLFVVELVLHDRRDRRGRRRRRRRRLLARRVGRGAARFAAAAAARLADFRTAALREHELRGALLCHDRCHAARIVGAAVVVHGVFAKVVLHLGRRRVR